MDYHTFIERVKSGDISIDTNGHNMSLDGSFDIAKSRLKLRIIDRVEWNYNYLKEKSEKDISDKFYSFGMWRLESDNAYIPDGRSCLNEIDYDCSFCGNHFLNIYLKDENTISLRKTIISSGISIKDFKKSYSYNPCIFSKGYKPVKTRINVPSGRIIFCNHFGEYPEKPKNMEGSHEFSLNTLIGRMNIAKHLSESNIGFGQVGNTSVGVYISKDKKSVKITESVDYIIDDAKYYEENDEIMPDDEKVRIKEAKNLIKGYEYLGSLCLDVWRWMCADLMVISEERLDINNNQEYNNYIECEIQSGEWEITHYYDVVEYTLLVSEMKLV